MVTPPLFAPGQTCADLYRISQLHSRSPASESYLALHTKTRTSVLLTCSRFEDVGSGPPSGAAFLTLALKLRQLALEDIPRVLDAGIDDDCGVRDGVYWVARERFDDAITVADFLGGAPVGAGGLAQTRSLMQAQPLVYRAALAMVVGLRVAEALGQAAAQGVFHGGLDPRTTIALRDDGSPTILDIGYRALFGSDYFTPMPGDPDFRAPELRTGDRKPDLRSDIYALGAIMYWMIMGAAPVREHLRSFVNQVDPSKVGPGLSNVVTVLARATEPDPKDRFQSWESVYDALLVLSNAAIAHGKVASKAGDAVANAATGATPEAPASGTRRSPADDDAVPTPRVPQAPAGARGEAKVNAGSSASSKEAGGPSGRPPYDAPVPAPSREASAPPPPRAGRALWAAVGAVCALIGIAALHSSVDQAHYAVPSLRGVRPVILVSSEPARDPYASRSAPPAPLALREEDRLPPESGPLRADWSGACSEWARCPSLQTP